MTRYRNENWAWALHMYITRSESLIWSTKTTRKTQNHELHCTEIMLAGVHTGTSHTVFGSAISTDSFISEFVCRQRCRATNFSRAYIAPSCRSNHSQKMMLLVEEKRVPVHISLVPMRSYGDKPQSFTRKVPSGLLPAMEVNGQIITESSVIMELIDRWHTPDDGYLPMMPREDDEGGRRRYEQLFRLERQLFSWWCTLLFRPEGPAMGGGSFLSNLMGGGDDKAMSGSMEGFLDCLQQVDR